jgi:uncharacterized protein (TIGR00369 family)
MSIEILEQLKNVLANQAFSVSLGAQINLSSDGVVELLVPITSRVQQQHGFVHGGVIAYLADNAMAFAGGTVLGNSVTLEFKINYLRPAKDGDHLLALATVVGKGQSQAVCRCDVFVVSGDERKLCAVAQGSIRKLD